MNDLDHRWDQAFTAVAVEKPGLLEKLVCWHRERSRRKWLIEHLILMTLVGVLTFSFGVKGLVVALVAFIVRDLVTALVIEILVAVIIRKARI